MACEIIGRGHDNARDCRDELGRCSRIDQTAQPNCDIDGVSHGILPPVLQQKLHMEVWMSRRERGQAGDGVTNAKTSRHAHPQQAAKFATLANAMLGLIESGEDGLHARKKLRACLGWHGCALASREKPGSQTRLEIGNDARGLGLRETAFTRCSRKGNSRRICRNG